MGAAWEMRFRWGDGQRDRGEDGTSGGTGLWAQLTPCLCIHALLPPPLPQAYLSDSDFQDIFGKSKEESLQRLPAAAGEAAVGFF